MTEGLVSGLSAAFAPAPLIWIAAGVFLGILVGAAPGLGPTVGMAIMLPVALRLPTDHAIFLLVSILVGSQYGNSIPAVLLRIPGSPSALLTVMEGAPLHERGKGAVALQICLFASVIGQILSIIVFVLFVIPVSQFAVRLLFPEIFAVTVFGLLAAASLAGEDKLKGIMSLFIGLALAMVGTDPITGVTRFTFGQPLVRGGLGVIPVVVGLLAFREVFVQAATVFDGGSVKAARFKWEWMRPRDGRAVTVPILVGSVIGIFIGAIPGAGGSVASFVAYQWMRNLAKDKAEYSGRGSYRGLAVIDSSNNAAAQGELIPTLGLGIPGAPAMVVLMAVLGAQGLIPGPQLLQTTPTLLHATFGGLVVATLALVVIGLLAVYPSVYLSTASKGAILATTTLLVTVGVYADRWQLFDVAVAMIMGGVGFVLGRRGFSIAAMALAFILGNMVEANLRRGLVMTEGFAGFWARPVTATLLSIAALFIVAPMITGLAKRLRARGV